MWKQKLEASQKDKNALQGTISQVQNSARQLRENLVKVCKKKKKWICARIEKSCLMRMFHNPHFTYSSVITIFFTTQEKTAMDRQNSKLQKEMSALRSELDTRDEIIRKSQRMLSDVQSDIKNLHKHIKEEQEKYHSE